MSAEPANNQRPRQQTLSPARPGIGGGHNQSAANPQLSLEFWTSMLARGAAGGNNNATALAAAAALQQQQPPFQQTNIRLPPAFNLTATIQHLLRTASVAANQHPGGGILPPSASLHHHQQGALLLQRALLGQTLIGTTAGGGGFGCAEAEGKMEEEEEEEDGGELGEEQEEETAAHPTGIENANAIVAVKNEPKAEMVGEGDESAHPAAAMREEGGDGTETSATPNRAHPQQQRRPRVGGSSAKTAEVWRFFAQRPNGEQAATCSICQKTIKATNSSTTGMIRHLRSCHVEQHHILQLARTQKALKNADDSMREQLLRDLGIKPNTSFEAIQAVIECSLSSALQNNNNNCANAMMEMPTMVQPKHSVESLINGTGGMAGEGATNNPENRDIPLSPGFASIMAAVQMPAEQRQLLEQIENFKTSRPSSIGRQHKREAQQIVAAENGGGGKRAIGGQGGGAEGGEAMMGPPPGNGGADDSFREPKRRKEEPSEPAGGGQFGAAPEAATKLPNGTTPKGTAATKKGAAARKAAGQPAPTKTAAAANNGEKESARISEQMAAMFLVDNTEFLLDRLAFRQFIHSILPHYQMPSKEAFRAEIIPRVAQQLEQLTLFREGLQRNNPLGLPLAAFHHHHSQHHHQLNSSTASSAASSTSSSACQSSISPPLLSTPSISNNSVISPSSSAEESGFHDEESSAGGDGQQLKRQSSLDVDELVQLAAIRSQNISRGFTYSLDLNAAGANDGSGTDASA